MAHNRYVARKMLEAVREFYRDPENERRYREWKSSRSEGGRVYAGKHQTRPVTVHMRTVPILTEGQREQLAQVIGGLAFVGVMALPGIIERAPWPAW